MATGKRTEREQSHVSPTEEAARRNEEVTDHQVERLRVLSQEVGEPFDESERARMTPREAERKIEDLQNRAGYGKNPPAPGRDR
ncbi:MAG TPA: hypothetical protein VD978_09515 [Azospirillum sp.]|nr:hypothetical protein [Azospirillum sp.]